MADGASFVRVTGGRRTELLPIADAPLTLRGAAGYNIDNALAALALAPALGIDDVQACAALREFVPSPDMLPGRTNVFHLDGVTAIVDFAHNPHGIVALADTVLRLPASRRLVVIGQAGDRDDESIRELTRAAVEMGPDRIIIKELSNYLRGREPGVVPGIIADELTRLDTPAEVVLSDGELSAVRDALEWCEPGDLLVFPIQAEREAITGLLDSLCRSGWSPGNPLPKT